METTIARDNGKDGWMTIAEMVGNEHGEDGWQQ